MSLLWHSGVIGPITGGFFVVPGVFVLIGLLTVWLGAGSLRAARAARTWPVVPGVVRRVEIRSSVNPAVRRGKRMQYTPYVEYEYPAGGAVRTSSCLRLTLVASGEVRARRIIAPYRAGQSVAVHVEPVPGGRSVLQAGPVFDDYFVFLCGLAFLAFGLGFTLLGWCIRTDHI